jgi:hypothetical protein
MNTKTVRGKNISIWEAHTTNPHSESRQAAKIKFTVIPVEKTFSIVVPDRLTTEKPGNEKPIKMPTNGHNKRKSQQPKCHIHYYFFDLSWCNARYCARKRHSVLDIFGVCYPPHQALNTQPKATMWYRAVIS